VLSTIIWWLTKGSVVDESDKQAHVRLADWLVTKHSGVRTSDGDDRWTLVTFGKDQGVSFPAISWTRDYELRLREALNEICEIKGWSHTTLLSHLRADGVIPQGDKPKAAKATPNL
jgi:hypothetical protein